MRIGNCGFGPADTVQRLSAELTACQDTAVGLTYRSLDRIHDRMAAGGHAFTRVFDESALAEAVLSDHRRSSRIVPSSITGLPISVKDLFDIKGDVTQAGSPLLRDAPAALADAAVVARLRDAGAIIVGKTNMTEFAFANTGVNRAFGTPPNPFDPTRLVGGSSSGAAVSVADGSVVAAIGSDTGGSIRGPAALCGLVGFKPSCGRVPVCGAVPLAPTFDTMGPIARTVACCAVVDSVLSGEAPASGPAPSASTLTLGIPTNFVLDDLDAQVGSDFARSVTALSRAGAKIVEFRWPELGDSGWWETYKIILRFESYTWHRNLFAAKAADYPLRLQNMMRAGARLRPDQHERALGEHRRLAVAAHATVQPFTAVLMPTVPIVPSKLIELDDPTRAERIEYLIGKNCEVANFFDFCSCTLPMNEPGNLPTGLLVMGVRGSDQKTLAVAERIEDLCRDRGRNVHY